jgi:serine/threonine-protein kinase HipA
MPLSEQPYDKKKVQPFLRGLLPDRTDVRERWARDFGLKLNDDFGLVAAIGADTAGGAVFAEPDQLEDLLARPGSTKPLSDSDIAARLRAVRSDDAAWHYQADEHWSLAGGQSKLTVTKDAAGWAEPTGKTPSTHIIKPGISRIANQALLEHLSMRSLALAGELAAPTEYRYFEDQPAIVVSRFDRGFDADGDLVRLHTEDLLQAFAIDPVHKYEDDGGPGAKRIAELLERVSGSESVSRFTRALIANQVLGASDAHAKNYSLILVGDRVTLAPLYDVATALVATDSGRLRYTKAAMSTGGETHFGEVKAKNWRKLAVNVGLPESQVLAWVAELAERIPQSFQEAVSELPAGIPGQGAVAKQVLPRIQALGKQILNGLDSR